MGQEGMRQLDEERKGWLSAAWLPLPPSANNLFSNTGGARRRDGRKIPRRKTKVYREWLKAAAGPIAAAQGSLHFLPAHIGIKGATAEVHILVDIDYTRDTDNIAKPVLDALAKHGVLGDDRYVDDHRVTRCKVPRGTVLGERGLIVKWRRCVL